MIARVLRTAIGFLATLAVADVVGVAVCFVLDVVPFRRGSTMALFAVWFVLGVFTGVIAYGQGGPRLLGGEKGDWTEREDAAKVGAGLLAVATVCLASLSLLFYLLWWRTNPEGQSFVPDSAAPTATFFGAVLGTMAFSRHVFKRPGGNRTTEAR